ncbi:MAG: alpha/beta hydrolase-fold protein [Saprospiraceae bacterium]
MIGNVSQSCQPIIEILDEAYEIPQLGRKRRIAVLLPHDYYSSNKSYPVIYLHDGQNLFDEYAPYGNWGIDKALNQLACKGLGDVIVVAIDHGGVLRIQEYLPYSTPRYTDSEGNLYLKFMLEDLKPMIDSKFRVLKERIHTGIGGSSLGGLISLYAGFKYPEIFGKMMIFSPSLWISEEIYMMAKKFIPAGPTDIYLYAGGMESSNHYGQVLRLESILHEKRRYDDFDITFAHNPTGQHKEIHWGSQFPLALKWLYYQKY